MYLSEDFLDLNLLENNPYLFSSLYEHTSLNEGVLGTIKETISNITRGIGSTLVKSGIDISRVIKEIRSEISISKGLIIKDITQGEGFAASQELDSLINKIWFRIREFYKQRGITGKGILILLFAFILAMTLSILIWTLMYHAIIIVIAIIAIPIITKIIELSLRIVKLNFKLKSGFAEDEISKTVFNIGEKLGIERENTLNLVAYQTKKSANNFQKNLERVLDKKSKDPNSSKTSKISIMLIINAMKQIKSGNFS